MAGWRLLYSRKVQQFILSRTGGLVVGRTATGCSLSTSSWPGRSQGTSLHQGQGQGIGQRNIYTNNMESVPSSNSPSPAPAESREKIHQQLPPNPKFSLDSKYHGLETNVW